MGFDCDVMPAIILAIGILVVWLSVRRIRLLSTKNFRIGRKVVECILLSIVVLVAAAAAGSTSFNPIARHHFWATNPPPGAFYTVNGHQMHMNCTGSGSPTMILESGLGNDALTWGGIQPELSRTTCSKYCFSRLRHCGVRHFQRLLRPESQQIEMPLKQSGEALPRDRDTPSVE